MYLAEAEATPALRDRLLAYDPAKISCFNGGNLSVYIGYIKKLVCFLNVHLQKFSKIFRTSVTAQVGLFISAT